MRRIRTKKSVCLVLILCAAMLFAHCADASEVIEDFRSAVAVRADSVLEVEENITINVDNTEIRHGIVRHFPVRYRDSDGRTFSVGFDVVSAELDGSAVPYKVTYEGAYANVRIGDAARTIRRGLRVFTLRYTTSRQVGFFDEYDELYWNVTGNGWSWPIKHASCTVSLPKESGRIVPFRSVEWYVGVYGARGAESDAMPVDEDTVATARVLQPGEGLTVVYTWDKGIVSPPPSPYGNERLQSMIAFAALLLSCAWFVFVLVRRTRRPPPAVIPRFYPPQGASPAFVRYIKMMKTDGMSVTSNIVGLAVKGALRIEEREKASFFSKTKIYTVVKLDCAAELTNDEDSLLARLFPDGIESISIEQKNAKILASASTALRRSIAALSGGLAANNIGLCITGALIFAAGLASTLPFTGDSIETTAVSGVAGGAVILIGCTRRVSPGGGFFSRARECAASLVPALIAAFVVFSVCGGVPSQMMIALPFVAAAAVTALLRVFVTERTERGAALDSEVKGLYLYITVAEKDRLEMLNPPDETPELFERLLPYAMALGAAKTWGDRFASVLERAGYEPRWYVGPSPYLFLMHGGLGAFSNALGSGIAHGMKPERAPSLSSGAGGRGFSGGGGGGGGGSGW